MNDYFFFEVKGDGIYYGKGPFNYQADPAEFSLYAPDFYLNNTAPFIVPDSWNKVPHFPSADLKISWGEILKDDYQDRFNHFIKLIDSGAIEKAVPVAEQIGEVISGAFPKLSESGSRFFLKEGKKVFYGSSPEVFLSKNGNEVYTEAVAGTALSKDAFNESLKKEHEIVIKDLKEKLNGEVNEPSLFEYDGLFHRKVTISAQSELGIGVLVRLLHPNAAIGLMPRGGSLEGLCPNRGRFGAPIGLVRGDEWAHLVLGIRSVEIEHSTAVLRAGSGVIKGRKFEEEYQEIELKMRRIRGD